MYTVRRKVILSVGIFSLALALRLPYVGLPILNRDETIYAVIAREILRGAVPYRDIWEIKPPLIFYLYALIFRLFGEISLTPVHIFAALYMAVTALVTADIARKQWGPKEGLIAGLGMAAYSTFTNSMQSQEADTELFLLLPQLLAIRFFLWARPGRVSRDMFISGLLSGIAMMFKQPAALVVILMGLWPLIFPPAGQGRFRGLAYFLSGAITVPAIFLIYFTCKGAFRDCLNLMVLNNIAYLRERTHGSAFAVFMRLAGGAWFIAAPNIVLWLLGYGSAIYAAIEVIVKGRAENGRMRNLFLAIYLIVCSICSFSGVTFYDHYYVMMIPALTLMWTYGTSALWSRLRNRATRVALALALFIGVLYPLVEFHFVRREWVEQFKVADRLFTGLGADIRARTGPDDRIFVWGLNPEIYFLAQRRPAGRFIYTTFQVGLVVGAPLPNYMSRDSDYVMPESWDLLMQDLETYKPVVFIDSFSMEPAYAYRYPTDKYPRLQHWLDVNYKGYYGVRKASLYIRNK